MSRQSLIDRAVNFDRIGDWDAAVAVYAQLFQRSAKQRDLSGLMDALRGSADARRCQGKYGEAQDLAELRYEIAERHGLIAEAARAMRMIGVIHHIRGDLKAAKPLYEKALVQLRDVGDDEQVGFTCQNLGVIANVQGDLREARFLYLESISAAIRSANPANTMHAYNNLAMVCADLQDWMAAEVYFDRATEIADQLGDLPTKARLQANRAEPLIRTSQFAEARKTLSDAERLAGPAGDPGTLADVARFRAMITREEGDLKVAAQHIADALHLATEAGLDLERAEALEELACIRAAEGRIDEAFSTLNEARQGYQALGAQRDAARALVVLESWSSRTSTAASTLPEVMP
jgi:tetratricopeptide (TPR) repeat protein